MKSWLQSWYLHPDLDNPYEDPLHAETLEWALSFDPGVVGDPEIYSLTLKYAERQYDQAVKLGEALDKKLDDLWRNALTIGAILSAAAKLAPAGAALQPNVFLIGAVAGLTATVVLSAHSRGPASFATPMQIRQLLDVIAAEPTITRDLVEAAESASYHYATFGMIRINLWKTRQIRRTTYLFVVSLVFPLAWTIDSLV